MIDRDLIGDARLQEIKIRSSMYDRFDFEQQIMQCWSVTSDVDTVYQHFYEKDNIDNDELANALIGIKSLYEMKFDRLWQMFELCLARQSDLQLQNQDLKLENDRLKSELENHPKVDKFSEV